MHDGNGGMRRELSIIGQVVNFLSYGYWFFISSLNWNPNSAFTFIHFKSFKFTTHRLGVDLTEVVDECRSFWC